MFSAFQGLATFSRACKAARPLTTRDVSGGRYIRLKPDNQINRTKDGKKLLTKQLTPPNERALELHYTAAEVNVILGLQMG